MISIIRRKQTTEADERSRWQNQTVKKYYRKKITRKPLEGSVMENPSGGFFT